MSDENTLGIPLDKNEKRKSERFLPQFYRTDSNKKFLSATVDPLIQRGTAKKLNGFIGRKNSKATKANDIFINEVTDERNNYQLEPCLTNEDILGNTTFFKDYIDYINTIDVFGGVTNNHQRLNVQEFYSWNPHICWDKFVNYLQYYWLPYGPETVRVNGTKTLDIVSTFKVEIVDEGDNFAYLMTPDALTRNPALRLYRGETYKFEINAEAYPLSIRTARVSSTSPEFRGSVSFNYNQHGSNNFVVDILTDFDVVHLEKQQKFVSSSTGLMRANVKAQDGTVRIINSSQTDHLTNVVSITPTAQNLLKIDDEVIFDSNISGSTGVLGSLEPNQTYYIKSFVYDNPPPPPEGIAPTPRKIIGFTLNYVPAVNLFAEVYVNGNKLKQSEFNFYTNDKRKRVLNIQSNIGQKDIVTLDFFKLKENDQFRYFDGIKTFEYLNDKLVETKNFSVSKGILEFTVSADAPDVLYYVSNIDPNTSGLIKIFDITENTSIDVDAEIVGKINYTSRGIDLSNGMKIKFGGLVYPESYRDRDFFVEGVGEGIKLIDVKTLEVVTDIAYNVDVNFDTSGYDELAFNNINYAALDKDYIVINRSSRDRNPWTRYNRWFHKDVIEKTAKILGKVAVFDQSQRAIRPIIEFNPNLRLYNFGNTSKKNIDLVDNFTKDAFSTIEGSLGYIVDGVELFNGHRIIFTADSDIRVKNKIYKVEFINVFNEDTGITKRLIHLAEEPDAIPHELENVLVLAGKEYGSNMVWFDGSNWLKGQAKTSLNQAPLFALFDKEGRVLNDSNKYDGSTFIGTKLFSYRIGNGSIDKELGFSLTYKNINNIGDIVFDFNLSVDTFKYKQENKVVEESISNKFLQYYTASNELSLVNGWTRNNIENVQPIIRIFKQEYIEKNGLKQIQINNFPLDVFEDSIDLEDLRIKVYVNNKKLSETEYELYQGIDIKYIRLENDIKNDDIVTLKIYTKKSKSTSKGHYEFPINFQNNPLNEDVTTFTLGEVIDHVDSIVDNVDSFYGIYPGPSNLRDIGYLSSKGTKFVQHSGSINLSLYHLANTDANIVRALEKSMFDYNNFKKSFMYNTEYLEEGLSDKDAVDKLLQSINQNKTMNMAYYFSDMLAYLGEKNTQFKIKEFVQTKFPLTENFTLTTMTPKAVYIYVNKQQLIYEKDYNFTGDGFVEIFVELKEDDIVDMYEYASTDGCFIPPTPTSLGLYPKYEPKIYLDTTLITPQYVIQGHDGSIILAFNDFRDNLILELEKRIFNNIKINYDPKILDIYDYIQGPNRPTSYSKDEFNQVLAPNFFKWTTYVDKDYTKSQLYIQSNPFTYNYSEIQSFDFTPLPGYWRGIYKWYFDTDRIHLCPWESLGFSVEPKWWQVVYGPAPYTSDNLILWNDLKEGLVREPNKPIRVINKFIKPVLENIPTNSNGALVNPIQANLATGLFNARTEKNYVFGDVSPVENAWRRSSYYPFAMLKTMILLTPNRVFSVYFDRSRIVRDQTGQLVYEPTGKRIKLKDILITNTINEQERVQTSGLVNYIVDYLITRKPQALENYKFDLKNLSNKIGHRLSGFSSEEKFNLILDSRNINSTTSVFVPKENYKIFLNTGSPTKRLFYSGVIITKLLTRYGLGYEIKGYSQNQPFFYYFPWSKSGYNINIGGISESYINYESNQTYVIGNIVKVLDNYYRVKISHNSGPNVDYTLLEKLPSLPIVGGVDAEFRSEFSSIPQVLNYGTILYSVQDVVDFILGYGEYLKSKGFIFDSYIAELKDVGTWKLSAKEFMFWITQNWGTGKDYYDEWKPQTSYRSGDLIINNNLFYSVRQDHTTTEIFDVRNYIPVENIDSSGASAISLSPAALGISLGLQYNVVDNIISPLDYEIFKSDGSKYEPNDLNYYRDGNKFTIKPKNEEQGIYGVGFHLVQKEHVLVIDNVTQFNDIIYNTSTGYRQERLKIYGYKTIDWNGSFDSPGFVYDSAYLNEWSTWTDYNVGDIVKYKEFFYTATQRIDGTDEFNPSVWQRLSQTPTSKLLPNWDYKSLQFLDFYDLDSDNFDSNQQAIAQHLIGYQKRQYLNNIIKNDVSEFKFYQGMITEKGTLNSLNKLFDVLGPDNTESLEFLEEWAVRVGTYGATNTFDEIEFVLDEIKWKTEPQAFELVNEIDPTKKDYVIRQTENDLYLKPLNYSNNIWPIATDYTKFLKTPGFSKVEFAKLILDDLTDIITLQDTESIDINVGEYAWCGFQTKINQFGDDWNIFRYNKLDVTVSNVTVSTTNLIITFNVWPNFVIGDVVRFISNYEKFNKFYRINNINQSSKTITVIKDKDFQINELQNNTVQTYAFNNQRYNDIDQVTIPKYVNTETNLWPYGELLWFTDNGKNSIWKNTNVYKQEVITNFSNFDNQEFGYTVAVNEDSTVLAVMSRTDEVWRSSWQSGTTYQKNNIVYRDNKFWQCISATSTRAIFNPNKYITNVEIIESTPGQKIFTCDSVEYLQVGSLVEIIGSFVGSAQIIGHVDGKTYKVRQIINNANQNDFILENLDGSNLTLAVGVASSVSFVLKGDWTETNQSTRQVLIYVKPYLSTQWAKKQVIYAESNVFNFGSSINIDKNGRFISITGIRKKVSNNQLESAVYLYSIPQKIVTFSSNFRLTTGNRLDYVNNKIVIPGHLLSEGTLVKYSTSDTPLKGLENNQEYYVETLDSESFRLTRDVDLIDLIILQKSVSGTHYITNLNIAQNYSLTTIISNTETTDINFGSKVKFALVPNANPNLSYYKIYISSYEKGVFVYEYTSSIGPGLNIDNNNLTGFAYDFDVNSDGTRIVVSAPTQGKIFFYNNSYIPTSIIRTTSEGFGQSLSLNNDGSYLAASSPLEDGVKTDQGKVRIYKLTGSTYILDQTIEDRNPETNEEFGYYIKFINNQDNIAKTLVIYSRKADSFTLDTYDDVTYPQIGESNTVVDVGRIDIYDRYLTKYIYSESLPASNIPLTTPYSLAIGENTVILGNPSVLKDNKRDGKLYLYTKKANTYSWQNYIQQQPNIKLDWFKKIFVYNKKNNSFISYLDIIDPVQGKIAGVAEQELKFKTYYDPATYSFKNSTFSKTVAVDSGIAWTDKHVGMLWWDLRRAKFLDAGLGDVVYNNSVWNTLFPTASIDIYEWVESKLLPSKWDTLADTVEGFADGISGTSLYGDNVYSTKTSYDTLGKKNITTYYFWVKNKRIIPNIKDRKYSASDVASLIENPKNYNIKYIQFTSRNSWGLVNVKNVLDKKDVALSVQYWNYEPDDLKIHSEFKILSNNEKTVIPASIEVKWFDSLVGFDKKGRMLPNLKLSPKLRYGIENKPNQTMFVNRLEALKIFIENLNYELKDIQIDNVDLQDLYLKDNIPEFKFGYYDYVKDFYEELVYIVVQAFQPGSLLPIISNGRLSSVKILSPGSGYKSAPIVKIKGKGYNAEVKTQINSSGSITNVKIVSSGYGYLDDTELEIRPLSVLIRSDKYTLNDWAIYHYINGNWIKAKTKEYDVTDYWYFIDWYAKGYNQYTKIDYIVKGFNELLSLKANIGDIVQIENTQGTTNWTLVEKISNDLAIDYTKIYKVVGKKNGAIQISNNFYNFKLNEQGYDGLLYDSDLYDRVGTIELKTILDALKNKILIDNRRSIYINLFFSSLKYILKEQPFVDWFFKTSFVKVLHNVGGLKQKVTFNNDNLSDYENYIREVKPFRTKIREFVSIYDNIENSNSLITDFDVPSYVTPANVIRNLYTEYQNNSVYVNDNVLINQYPYKSWIDNVGFGIKEVVIVDSGQGYIDYPNIKITGACKRPAKIKIYISRAKISKIDILDAGEGYFTPPKIKLEGQFTQDGYEAKVIAILGNNPIRSNHIAMKFDRYAKETIANVQDINVIENFIGDSSTTSFILKYSPEIIRNKINVYVDNVQLFNNQFSITKTTNNDKKYKVYLGNLILTKAPVDNAAIRIEYVKDFNNLNALERIKHYYTPTAGMLGLEFDQLMTGIDYAGVSITGIGFDKVNTWDGEYTWSSKGWDAGDPTDDERYDIIIDGGNLPKLNAAYRTANGIRAEDIIIDGDSFITPMTSPAPEEMVPGHTADTLAIKVFERNISVTSEINCVRYITDGISNEFKLDVYPNNEQAIIVKLDDNVLDSNQYVFDFNTLTLTLIQTPPINKDLSIICFGFNGNNLLAIDKVVVTERSDTVILNTDWQDNISVYTVVAGDPTDCIPFQTFGAYQSNIPYKLNDKVVYQNQLFQSNINNNFNNVPLIYSENDRAFIVNNTFWTKIKDGVTAYADINKIAVLLPITVDVGDVIVYSVFIGDTKDQSVLTKEIVVSNGTSTQYTLSNFVGYSFPLASNTLVRINNTVLNSIDQFKFTLKNRVTKYIIPLNKGDIDVYSSNDYEVYINSIKVPDAIAYTLNLLDNTITIKPNYYRENAEVLVAITKFSDYTISNATGKSVLTLRQTYPAGTRIEVIAMTNHDILKINRNYLTIEKNVNALKDNIYKAVLMEASGGILYLGQEIVNSNYVWVTKNKELLVPLLDYQLREDKSSIKLSKTPSEDDVFGLITFTSNIVRNPVSFMQFKDMLNDFSYKRLNKYRTTRLKNNLNQNDKEIIVEDSDHIADGLRDSNTPGVIYVNGERIEYFVRTGNKLSEIRRGTRGTGAPQIHKAGVEVYDIGIAETIPYSDTTSIYKILGTWIPSYRYLINDVVTYNNENWISITGINYDLWTATKTYKLNQQIIFNHNLYIAIKEIDGTVTNTNKSPNTENTWWQLEKTGVTQYPSLTNTNWEKTKIAYFDDFSSVNDPYGKIVLPWMPIVQTDINTPSIKTVLDTEIFIGTERLKKVPYTIHDRNINPHSPEGDVNYPRDFVTDATNHSTVNGEVVVYIKLENDVAVNSRITIVRKQGRVWSDLGFSLSESANKVAEFLKVDVAKFPGTTPTFDSRGYTIDSGNIRTDEE